MWWSERYLRGQGLSHARCRPTSCAVLPRWPLQVFGCAPVCCRWCATASCMRQLLSSSFALNPLLTVWDCLLRTPLPCICIKATDYCLCRILGNHLFHNFCWPPSPIDRVHQRQPRNLMRHSFVIKSLMCCLTSHPLQRTTINCLPYAFWLDSSRPHLQHAFQL